MDYFKNLFRKQDVFWDDIQQCSSPKANKEQNEGLIAPFLVKDVKDDVFS